MMLEKQLEYVYPELLVDTRWVEAELNDPKIRISEVDYDRKTNYELCHMSGSIQQVIGRTK